MLSLVEVPKKTCAKKGCRPLASSTHNKKSIKDDDAPMADVTEDDGIETFRVSERASVSDFFTNEDDIQQAILRRWCVLINAQPVAKKAAEPNPNVKVLPMLLDEQQLTFLNYIYIGPTKSGEHMYGIKKAVPPAASTSEGKKKTKVTKPDAKHDTCSLKRKMDASAFKKEEEAKPPQDRDRRLSGRRGGRAGYGMGLRDLSCAAGQEGQEGAHDPAFRGLWRPDQG